MITADPHASIAEVAAAAGLALDAVRSIVADLEQAGYLTRPQPGGAWRVSSYTERPGDAGISDAAE